MSDGQVDRTTGEVLDRDRDLASYIAGLTTTDNTSYSYPDYLANVSRDSAESLKSASVVASCGRYVAIGYCPDGTQFRKVLLCRREWCGKCGANWSDAHRRRYVSWYPRLRTFGRLGYLVITTPPQDRPRTAKDLSAQGSAVVKVLKDHRIRRGLRRWHFFGDLWVALWLQLAPHLPRAEAERLYGQMTTDDARRLGVKPGWHPHLNILIDGEDIPSEHEAFVTWWAELREDLSTALGCAVNLHYEFAEDPAQKVHIGKYVTRATFLDPEWDAEVARDLVGFRNAREWGSRASWAVEPLWQMTEPGVAGDDQEAEISDGLVHLHNGECPVCAQPVKWSGIERTWLIRDYVLEDYGSGYFRVKLPLFGGWDFERDHDTS